MLYKIHNLKATTVLIVVVVGRELGYIGYIGGYNLLNTLFSCLLP